MVSYDDDANKSSEGSSQKGEKRCFDSFATLLLAYNEIRARRGKEVQERNKLMIHTITSAATNTFLLGKRKIDDDHDHECKNQENTASSSSSSSLVESKRRRVESDDEPIRAQPIREIKPPVKEKEPVRKKPGVTPGWLVELMRRYKEEPVRREPVVTPGWVIDLMKTFKGRGDAKMIFEKVLTKTDLKGSQGRLLMPFNQMSDMDFLTEAELKILEKHHNEKNVKKGVDDDSTPPLKGVDFILLRRSGTKGWNLNMRIWEMKSSFNYVLCTGWNKVVSANDLQTNQTITLWSFHSHDGKLYFAFDLPIDQDEAMAQALVPVNPEGSSSDMALGVISEEDPFDCEEAANRRLYPFFPKKRRTPRVCVGIIINDPAYHYLHEGGLGLNRTPPEECTEMAPDPEDVQATHIRTTSQESLTETTLVSGRCLEEGKQVCSM